MRTVDNTQDQGYFKSTWRPSSADSISFTYLSDPTDVSGRISKVGDHGVRVALYEAANVILTRPVRGSALKSWALAVARRAGRISQPPGHGTMPPSIL